MEVAGADIGLLAGLATAWLVLELIAFALGLVALVGVGLFVLTQFLKRGR